jgi:3'-phosphoadenosine 5'-phosphosulfate sulfotransferase (PAPS reductase)/FAD synthetase
MKELTILSLGAGVQSTTMLLMALEGMFDKTPDCAIFADTGYEPKSVYKHLDWLIEKVKPFPVHIVSVGNIKEDTLAWRQPRAASINSKAKPFNTIPTFTLDGKGKIGMFPRQCTQEYKLGLG